ncbi:LamG-like jellyroll fold domain-containing protein [Nocardia transvalensis]|uniref:LamG-like jellyroll fold domain-containing protein n=1 Tax=Nocardia transvalensis TaxID=37333 RepID=UPI0018947657|nr:LamG-like jellyroll fold domain-containing protein [Nocardia transvalensis]MBF6328318.1 hypothetical protein [Nocardia transvalensis]
MSTYPTAFDRMAGALTSPFAAGADRLRLSVRRGEVLSRGTFEPYDLGEHRARFGTDPRPRFLVTALVEIPPDISLRIGYHLPGTQTRTLTFPIPEGTVAGTSLLIPLGPDAAEAVLDTVTVDRPPGRPGLDVVRSFRFTVLLGDLAALLWVLGGERDELTAHANRVRGERSVARASGLSLDLIGSDLGIPRFPPLPYGFADDTIALYHLEDADPRVIADEMTLYTKLGHPGAGTNVAVRVDGRFGFGVGFVADRAEIAVPDHPDFALPEGQGFTAECFVRPAPGKWTGAVVSKHADPADLAEPGWGVHIGRFHGLDRNVKLVLSDGAGAAPAVELYADISLATDRFQHVAAVVDGDFAVARLYVDGTLVATGPAELGAMTNTAPLRIGFGIGGTTADGTELGFYGTIDEVRISGVARPSFAPVLGEDDGSYRQRLALFRRWNLPTPPNIERALNAIVGPIDNVENPITVSDAFVRSPVGSHTVTIRPVELRPGESIDACGRRRSTEAEVCGTVADDLFDPGWLVTYPAGGPPLFPAADRRMRLPTLRRLRKLVELMGSRLAAGLTVSGGFDPAARDLRATGRALIVRHASAPGRVAALAHRAGFDWVHYRSGEIYLSVADTGVCEIVGYSSWFGKDLAVDNAPVELSINPDPAQDSIVRWTLLQAGPGRAAFDGSPSEHRIRLRALHPGEVTVQLEVRRSGKSFTSTRRFTIAPQGIPAGTSIGTDGTIGVSEDVAGTADDGAYVPDYLVTVTDPLLRIDTPGSNRMQANVAVLLGRLLINSYRATYPRPPQIRLVSGWQPNGTGLDRVGRALTLAPAVADLSLSTLALAAYGAGFDYVVNTGTVVRVAQRAGDHIAITGPAEAGEGGVVPIAVPHHDSPIDAVLAGTVLCTANSGSSTVVFSDSTDGTLLATATVGPAPIGIAVSPDRRTVYTASATDRTISAVTVGISPVVTTLPALPAAPIALACHPTKPLLVLLLPTQVVTVDATTGAVVTRWTIPNGSTGKLLALNPTGATAWVACTDKTLRAVDLATGTFAAAPTLPGTPTALAVSSTSVYAATAAEARLWVLDAAQRTVTGTFDDIDLAVMRIRVDETAGVVYLGAWYSKFVQRRTLSGAVLGPDSYVTVPGIPVAVVPAGAVVLTVLLGEIGRDQSDAVAVLRTDRWREVDALWPLAPAGGRTLSWSVAPYDEAAAHLDGSTGELAELTAERAGVVQVRVRARAEGNPPYTVRIGLAPILLEGEQQGRPVVIRRAQYERIMNVLNELHPIGVEFDTSVIRDHVLELKRDTGQLDVFPAYTYPSYRLRGRQLARPNRKD